MKALRQQMVDGSDQWARADLRRIGYRQELVAHAIHMQSLRKDEMFVEMNCAAIPEDLIDSELFGHRKSSFPGATADKEGKFQKADAALCSWMKSAT